MEKVVGKSIGLIGRKVGMTQIFSEKGVLVPVTVLQAGPCTVVQKRVRTKDGYDAVQVGFDPITKKRGPSKPAAGQFKKAGVAPQRRNDPSGHRRHAGGDGPHDQPDGEILPGLPIGRSGPHPDDALAIIDFQRRTSIGRQEDKSRAVRGAKRDGRRYPRDHRVRF